MLGYDGDFDLARSNINDCIRSIALRKNNLFLWMCRDDAPLAAVSKNTAGSNRRLPLFDVRVMLCLLISAPCNLVG
jgi:hypothetical protein